MDQEASTMLPSWATTLAIVSVFGKVILLSSVRVNALGYSARVHMLPLTLA